MAEIKDFGLVKSWYEAYKQTQLNEKKVEDENVKVLPKDEDEEQEKKPEPKAVDDADSLKAENEKLKAEIEKLKLDISKKDAETNVEPNADTGEVPLRVGIAQSILDKKKKDKKEVKEELNEATVSVFDISYDDVPKSKLTQAAKKFGIRMKKLPKNKVSFGGDDAIEFSGSDSNLLKFAKQQFGTTARNVRDLKKELEEETLDEAKVKIRNTGKSLENKVMMIVKSDNLNISLSKSMDMRDIIADGNPRDIRILQKKLKEEVDIEEKGLWHNIHMKRKRGETMRKKGEKGAPTPQQMARAKAASEDPEVRQDPDVKDKKGTQPAKYYAGKMSKSTKSARDAHFKKGTKMDDDNPAAYKPAPGDASGKTKPSKHTLAFKKKFGEDVKEEIQDIKTWSETKETINQYKDEYGTDYRVKLDQTVSEMFDELLSENEGVKKKAAKSGMPYGVLMKVYNRGMAAWRTGHRPGTTPQQWGMARVNSFVTKSSGTWGKADSDLAAKVRGK